MSSSAGEMRTLEGKYGRGRGIVKGSVSLSQGLQGSGVCHPCVLYSVIYELMPIRHSRILAFGVCEGAIKSRIRFPHDTQYTVLALSTNPRYSGFTSRFFALRRKANMGIR